MYVFFSNKNDMHIILNMVFYFLDICISPSNNPSNYILLMISTNFTPL
jgi:hypothetical protein